ncbi:chalcone synthase-like [Lolium perenne]|uniref:chalcone synthase-like n=1 Tax=Lolium perenne TaxID=4522 RepID=UPI003A995912
MEDGPIGKTIFACHSDGLATIIGLGSATPPNIQPQISFADYYFQMTNSNDMVDLKAKFKRICDRTAIEKRHLWMSHDFLMSNPTVTAYSSPSLNVRQELTDAAIPQLGAEAARIAIGDWGGRASDITHLVLCTTSSGRMPGADFDLVKLLGLKLTTKRFMLYQTGCHGGGMSLRLAKDLAENNPGARVLVVCSEVTSLAFRGPSETHPGNLVGQALFGDAAGAVIVGAHPTGDELPLFEMVSASQDIIPGTEKMVEGNLCEEGLMYTLDPDNPLHVSRNIEGLVKRTLEQAGLTKDWNEELFWLMHPGGRAILDRVESTLGLRKDKMQVSREVMRQHGNTMSSCVIIAMEEMRRVSEKRVLPTAGEGLEWGLLFGFGPGLTIETILLRSLPNKTFLA